MNSSSAFSDPEGRLPAAGSVAGRPSSDRLSLSGRSGPGVADYRSEFVHLWVVGGEVTAEELHAAIGDLERAARVAAETPSTEPGLPLPVRQFFAGLAFLRDHLWSNSEGEAPGLVGFLLWDGRLWALGAGVEARLDQMTGAPTRVAWHEAATPQGLTWGEADAAEVWRIECAGPAGILSVHARPPLASVLGTMRDEAMSDSSTPIGPELRVLPPPVEPEAESEAMVEPEVEPEIEPEIFEEEVEAADVPTPATFEFPQDDEPVDAAPVDDAPVDAAPADAEPALEPMKLEPAAIEVAPERPAAPPRPVAVAKTSPRTAPRAPRLPSLSFTVPPFLRSKAGLAVIALVLATAIAVAFVWAREPVARAFVGNYDLVLTTSPAGATVRVDGQLAAGRTPMTLALEPGEHRVEVAYGDYANAVVTVEGDRGETVERSFTWAGSLALSSADTTAKLQVSFDGQPWGALPLWRDDVPVGRHRLSFQGEGVRPWEEEVQIKVDQSTRLVAEPMKVPGYGLVTARAERVSADGVDEVEGASVFVDGQPAGGTPVDLRLSPGPHSVRIASGAELGPVHLIEVQPGGRFFASTTFGRPAEPEVAFDAPRTVAKTKPAVLTVQLIADVPLPVRRMRLFTRKPGATSFDETDIPFAIRDNGRARGAIAFPAAGLAPGAQVRYYVGIQTREGEEYFSEVRTATITP